MNDNAHELVVVVFAAVLHGEVIALFLLREVLLREVGHVQRVRELIEVVDFNSHHRVKIELEALQRGDQVARQCLDTGALERIHLLIALLTLVLVVSIKHVARYESLEPLNDRLFVFDRDTNR